MRKMGLEKEANEFRVTFENSRVKEGWKKKNKWRKYIL